MSANSQLTINHSHRDGAMVQSTLFGQIPENEIETISLSTKSEDMHSAVVETKNRINSTNQNRINDNVAVINIDGKYRTHLAQKKNKYQLSNINKTQKPHITAITHSFIHFISNNYAQSNDFIVTL